ncbi:alpha/beta hydrolase family protein [Sphingomonas morindae]|uniref:Alpha/beta fold hydrolase n=1 Tax=Sphingomonas morindae TaxID=1541170 RepID=A0ABY4XDY3_9SPHN|nr:alpha/beta fold hydrolase [Sphingomonas morindae]USI75148.1 alpha/beta fold hydrolase [Sphingomonas morindae]
MQVRDSNEAPPEGTPVRFFCDDGVLLRGTLWASTGDSAGQVILNPATGVLARYYHRYARFLAAHGLDVLTYDYRGIGGSRPADLRGCEYRWVDWGLLDFEAALAFMRARGGAGPLSVVGHSFGGVIPGLARNAATQVDRLLTVGAQYAWWGDYARDRRAALFGKWHVLMPLLTTVFGYFPGKRLGWLEDLPAGVAHAWSFGGPRFESRVRRGEGAELRARIAAFPAPILAVVVSDDELATPRAIRRTLDYYESAPRTTVLLRPSDFGRPAIGHFNLFHDSHAAGFWQDTLCWLTSGVCPWPDRAIDALAPQV